MRSQRSVVRFEIRDPAEGPLEQVVSGQWSVVSGQWSVVGGQWSVVGGQWSVVSGRWFLVSDLLATG